jgi:Ca2+-binding EF-hand superfamily protein
MTQKNKFTLLATALMIGASSLSASGQTSRQAFGTGDLPEFLKAYDLDGDGKLSVEERQAFEKASREAKPPRPGAKNPWDTDGDGVLSDTERQAARDAIAAKMEDQRSKRFNELDKDSDGFLINTELKAIPRITDEMIKQMITHLDKNSDQKISKEEFLAVLTPVAPPIPAFPLPIVGAGTPFPLIAFDTDKNGRLSVSEVMAVYKAIDTNADGRVSTDEWKAYVLANPDLLPAPPSGEGDGLPPAPTGR